MIKSSTLGEFAKAMNQFKKEHPQIELDEKVTVYKRGTTQLLYSYMFASMNEIQTKVDPYLESNGLSIIQGIEEGSRLSTLVLHTSGEFIETIMDLDVMREVDSEGNFKSSGPQEFGALVTYARRYAKLAALNLSPMKKVDNNNINFRENPTETNIAPTNESESPKDNPKAELPWLNLRMRSGSWSTDGQKAIDFLKTGGTIDHLKQTWRINKESTQELFNIQRHHLETLGSLFTAEIRAEINKAGDTRELSAIHEKYPKLHDKEDFITALSQRRVIVQKPKQATV